MLSPLPRFVKRFLPLVFLALLAAGFSLYLFTFPIVAVDSLFEPSTNFLRNVQWDTVEPFQDPQYPQYDSQRSGSFSTRFATIRLVEITGKDVPATVLPGKAAVNFRWWPIACVYAALAAAAGLWLRFTAPSCASSSTPPKTSHPS